MLEYFVRCPRREIIKLWNMRCINCYRNQEVWPPVCPRPPLMTDIQHFISRIKKRQRWDVQTMWVYDLDLWPWESEYEVQILVILWLLIFNMTNWPTRLRLITWPCDPDLWRHGACGWCGSSSSICIPSLKFVGLAIRKIWHTMCVSINGPGMTLTFDLRGHGACGWCGSSSSIRVWSS